MSRMSDFVYVWRDAGDIDAVANLRGPLPYDLDPTGLSGNYEWDP